MKNIKILSIFLMLVIFFASCEKDDYTGASTQTPTNPTITVDFGNVQAVTDGVNSSHKVTLTMDVPQIVDVRVYILNTGGTATPGVDFTVPDYVMIPAGRTSASFDVKFLADELPESTETFTIQIGDEKTANAKITPVTQEFTILNASEDDLNISLSWNREIYDATGALIDPTDLVDMRLLITDMSGNIVDVADGGSFEAYTMTAADYPDGQYMVATDYYSSMDLGDQGSYDLDFTLDFKQIGVFEETRTYNNLMNNILAKDARANFVIVTKTGTTWTIEDYVPDLSILVGDWTGTDGSLSETYDWRFDSHITSYLDDDGNLRMDSLNYLWMQWVWGEEQQNYDSLITIVKIDGSFTIAPQYHMTTLYDGDLYDYDAYSYGTGIFINNGTDPIRCIFNYELNQDGFLVAANLATYADPDGNAYSDYPYFLVDVELNTPKHVNSYSPPIKINH